MSHALDESESEHSIGLLFTQVYTIGGLDYWTGLLDSLENHLLLQNKA